LKIRMKRIALLGTGAIGSCVGADLTKAGQNVVLIDQWPAHVEAMKTHGLRIIIQGKELHTPVQAVHLCEVCTLQQQFDIVFLTAKSYDTRWMVEFIKPYLKPDGILVSLQNSLNDEWIAPIIGYGRDIASVIELSAEIFEPGWVKRNTDHSRTWFALGELHGRLTTRLHEVAQILGAAGKTEMSTNIWGAKWTKLSVNCMTQAVAGILGMFEWEIPQNPKALELCIKLGRECLQVGKTLGYRLEPIFGLSAEEFLGSTDEVLKKNLITLISHIGKEARNSILQDHLKGRHSEVDFINGLVVKKGKEAKVQTPLNEAVTSLTKQIEQKTFKPNRSNLKIIEELME
jgi:2-dehydropantoate 2-reductase